MRGKSARTGGNRGWQKVVVEADNMTMVAEKLRETGMIAGDGEPVEAHAHFDAQRRLRRIHARYANGWRATLNIRVDGSYSLSQALKLVCKPKAVSA